jgi:hypothetical protein
MYRLIFGCGKALLQNGMTVSRSCIGQTLLPVVIARCFFKVLSIMKSASFVVCVLAQDIFEKARDQYMVLTIGGAYAAAHIVAACPFGTANFGFLDNHCLSPPATG